MRMPELRAALSVGCGCALLGAAPLHHATPPSRIASCDITHITSVTQRLEDAATHRVIASSGSAVTLADGVYGVSYDEVAAVNASRPGDPAITCLIKLPTHCPPGDHRGKKYTTTNLRTDQSWTLPDAEHQCGGA